MQASPLITLSPSSPSFNSYSSSKLAEIAARVVQEFANESESSSDDITNNNIFSWDEEEDKHFQQLEQKTNYNHQNDNELHDTNDVVVNEEDEDEDEDFEFAVVSQEPDLSPISADDIFCNGQIRPIYPLFHTDLLLNDHQLQQQYPSFKSTVSNKTQPKKSHRLPLRKLFDEERETVSCSSSEADELDGVPDGTYCVWTPKKAESSLSERCKKSSSTGSSKRWKFRDLLYRSNSDGKDTFVFLTPSGKKSSERLGGDKAKENKEKRKEVFEEHYVRNRAIKGGDKRRSFLPYRQDLVGFLSNVNGLGKNLHPF